jgi:hypothetical protein
MGYESEMLTLLICVITKVLETAGISQSNVTVTSRWS